MDHYKRLEEKIMTSEKLRAAVARWRLKGDRIVFTNGCFDLLHRGHLEYLAHAADHGDHLVVGLNTDDSVCALKGPGRPINDQQSRALVMAGLSYVSAVCFFSEPTPYELIRMVQPDVLVKGADYKAEEIVGYDIVKARGGEVVTIPLVSGYSTTAIEARIRNAKP
jgi:D-glycero-beta-D-manno-heptose 1-phosphate adenylyltransferase